MSKPLTVTFHMGGRQIDRLTDAQCEKMARELSETMSRYYTTHIDEYKQIKN